MADTTFPAPIRSFDVHIYFFHNCQKSTDSAAQLHKQISEKFPDLPLYKLHLGPIGPHPFGMFEVDLKTPEQFGRGNAVLEHTENAIWIGEKVPLNLNVLRGA